MSNVRPWFRLSSIARPTSQGSSDPPPPPPQPRPTPRRPVTVRPREKQPSPPRQQTPPPPSPPQQQRQLPSTPRQSPPRQQQQFPSTPRQQQQLPSPPQQQRQLPSTPRQQQQLPSPPRQQQQFPSTPRQQQQLPSPPRQQQQLPSPPRQQTPPPPQERSPYHSPPSRHMSPPTPPKAATPPPPPPRSSYTPPPSTKEVQETFPPRKQDSPPSPAHSTRSSKYDPESPRQAPSPQRVLSPYSLPPSRLHSEHETTQKNMLTLEKSNQFHEPNHHQENSTKKIHHQQPFSGENIMGTRVITIAGENKGAVMEILRSPRSNKTGGSGTHSSKVFNGTEEKGRRLQSSSSSSSSDEGEGKKKTTKNPNKIGNNSNLPMKAFMNSNVQMINNSIVYNSTGTHHDPGVHFKISRKPGSGNGFHVKDYGDNGGYTN